MRKKGPAVLPVLFGSSATYFVRAQKGKRVCAKRRACTHWVACNMYHRESVHAENGVACMHKIGSVHAQIGFCAALRDGARRSVGCNAFDPCVFGQCVLTSAFLIRARLTREHLTSACLTCVRVYEHLLTLAP